MSTIRNVRMYNVQYAMLIKTPRPRIINSPYANDLVLQMIYQSVVQDDAASRFNRMSNI